jgi:succinoglycan biosynthesis protein ExoH
MLVSFYIGGLAVSQNWNLSYLDHHAKWLCSIFIILCISIVLFDMQNIELFRLVCPFLAWPSISLILNTKFGDFLYENSKSSFFTFLTHAPILLFLWLGFQKITIDIPYSVYWFFAPPITVYISILFYRYFKWLLPKRVSSIALGGR